MLLLLSIFFLFSGTQLSWHKYFKQLLIRKMLYCSLSWNASCSWMFFVFLTVFDFCHCRKKPSWSMSLHLKLFHFFFLIIIIFLCILCKVKSHELVPSENLHVIWRSQSDNTGRIKPIFRFFLSILLQCLQKTEQLSAQTKTWLTLKKMSLCSFFSLELIN